MTDTDKSRPDEDENAPSEDTPGGQPPETVDDRPDGSRVTPEDYPLDQRAR